LDHSIFAEVSACGQHHSESTKHMTLRQFVRRAGLPPASQSNFESLAIDGSALPRQRKRNEQKLTGGSQRSSPQREKAQEELSLASVVLFAGPALDATCCPRGWRNAARQAAKFIVAEQVTSMKPSSEVGISLSRNVSSSVAPEDCTRGFDQGGACCGSSDSIGDQECRPHSHNQ